MGTSAASPLPFQYNNTNNQRAAAQNQRALNQEQGDQLQSQYGSQYNAQQGGAPVNTVASSANYLNQIEDPLAQGNGGYNATESSQIDLTPQQEQNIATNAGVAAGSTTQAGVGAAERATAAAGGNPLAMAAYRARAADTAGSQAGAATTAGEIGAQQAGSAGAQAVGNARLAQQNQGLSYYTGQNAQANQNAQQANQLQESTYGTEANAGNTATGNVLNASQTPSTLDKITGAVGGALGALDKGAMPTGKEAIAGENGPEWVGRPNYLDMGDPGSGEVAQEGNNLPTDYSGVGSSSAGETESKSVPFWQRIMALSAASKNSPNQKPSQWSPATPYSQLGAGVGNVGNLIGEAAGAWANGQPPEMMGNGGWWQVPAAIGGMNLVNDVLPGGVAGALDNGAMPEQGMPANQMDDEPWPPARSAPPRSMLAQGAIITKPTNIRLEPDEAVVPLSYRAQAKARPSMAMAKKPAARQMYGAAA